MLEQETRSRIPKPRGRADYEFSLAEKMSISKETMTEIRVSQIKALLSALTSATYQ